jgi:hypothetical protein
VTKLLELWNEAGDEAGQQGKLLATRLETRRETRRARYLAHKKTSTPPWTPVGP